MQYEFLDMDTVIETETGMAIPEIFDRDGEAAFRVMETDLVGRLAGKSGCVIATGGGTIVNPDNLKMLKNSGIVITLTADPQTILSRVGSGEDRPMLAGGDKTERIAQLIKKRAHAYAQADITVDTASRSIDEVAQFILDTLKSKLQFSIDRSQ